MKAFKGLSWPKPDWSRYDANDNTGNIKIKSLGMMIQVKTPEILAVCDHGQQSIGMRLNFAEQYKYNEE